MNNHFLPEGICMGEFKPFAAYDRDNDTLTYLASDVSILEEQSPDSTVVILRDVLTRRVVGVRIEQFSKLHHEDIAIVP